MGPPSQVAGQLFPQHHHMCDSLLCKLKSDKFTIDHKRKWYLNSVAYMIVLTALGKIHLPSASPRLENAQPAEEQIMVKESSHPHPIRRKKIVSTNCPHG